MTLPSTRTRVRAMVSVPSVNETASDHRSPSTSARRRPSSDSSQQAASRSPAAAGLRVLAD